MKVIILAGGYGLRLTEKTQHCPKPMIEIGPHPILWHIMQRYSFYGMEEFFVACGYKQEVIKQYFLNFYAFNQDISISLESGQVKFHEEKLPKWKVHLIDTGIDTQTGGRIRKLKEWIGNETFMLTYGDGLADIDLNALLQFHKAHHKLATVSAVRPPARFGCIELEGNKVSAFTEKSQTKEGWINGGYFVLEPEIFDLLHSDEQIWEKEPLEKLAQRGELMAYQHEGFFQPMDTLRDYNILQKMYLQGNAPWLKKKEFYAHV